LHIKTTANELTKAAAGAIHPRDDLRPTAGPQNLVYLAAAYGQLGQEQKAKKALETANVLRARASWGALNFNKYEEFLLQVAR
jgi:hypothetical protein